MTVTTTAEPAAQPRLHRGRLPVGWSQGIVWGAVVVLVIGPLLPLLYASFRSKPYYLPGGVFTVQGYRTLFADPAFWRAVQNTLLFAVGTTVLAVTAASAFAILCGR